MAPWVVIVLLVVFVASGPIEARLWRAGRLSDQTAATLLLGRTPAFVLVVALVEGASPLVTIGLVVLVAAPAALAYRFVLRLLAEQRGREPIPPQAAPSDRPTHLRP